MLPEIKRILYPTDLSENARFAFGYAASLGNRYGAGITILHVLEELSPNALGMVVDLLGAERWEELKRRNQDQVVQAIRERIKSFCEEVNHKLSAFPVIIDDIIVEIGHPVDRIIRQTEKSDCHIVVMGSHGQGMLSGTMIGSTSRKVLRRCKRPVLVVRQPEDEH